MRVRQRTHDETKVELQMTPMIDVVFQLLIFFLFTFKIRPIEGEIAVRMAPPQAGEAQQTDTLDLLDRLHVRLEAGADGQLADIIVEEQSLGTDLAALAQLIRALAGNPPPEDTEVELDVDDRLLYGHVLRVSNVILRTGIRTINFTDR